jgi:hypothetical protein
MVYRLRLTAHNARRAYGLRQVNDGVSTVVDPGATT